MGGRMTLEFEVDVDCLTDGGIRDMPTWVKLNDEGGERTSTVYVNTNSYWHVVDENAKLRELVREMHATISRNNSWWDCTYKDTRRFADRMRELGAEVDDGNRGVEQGERDE